MCEQEVQLRDAEITKDGLIGITIEPTDTKPFLIRGTITSGGPVVLADTTFFAKRQFTGHKPLYQKLLPKNFEVRYLPTIESIQEGSFIKDVVTQSNVVLFQGGEDPGPPFQTAPPETDIQKQYGGMNALRDAINYQTLEEVRKRGHDVFVIGICRGMELFAAFLYEAQTHHRPTDQSSDMTTHDIEVLPSIELQTSLGLQLFPIPSNHHLQVKGLSPKMAQEGWQAYYEDRVDHGIEIMIRVNSKGIISGVLFQGHPERYPESDPIGNQVLSWIHQCITVHQTYCADKKQ